jgi:hypothetical protein
MTKTDFENIKNKILDIKNQPNSELYEVLEKISVEFDITKNSILSLSSYLDELENIYNTTLKEYEKRTNVKRQ